MERIASLYTAILMPVLFLFSCTKQYSTNDSAATDNDHLLLGNPSRAVTTMDSVHNYLLVKPYYCLSYDSARGIPNWVSWHLSAADLDTFGRRNNFRSDTTLPASWYRATDASYRNTGFNRGHHCPSGDRTVSYMANSSTFLMTNILPQAPNNNVYTWALLEDSIRILVRAGAEAFIQMGSYGVGGTGDSGFVSTLDKGRIIVPAFLWKLVVFIPNGNNDLKRIDKNARVIAVIIPNINSVSSNWKIYRTNAIAIQAATGYSLLTNVPVEVRKVLLSKIDGM